jgi:hypothetical protein
MVSRLAVIGFRSLCAVLLTAGGAVGQAPVNGEGFSSLAGTVVDEVAEAPLANVFVCLRRASGGPEGESGCLWAETDARGQFEYPTVSPRAYQLRVHRIGYRDVTINVDLGTIRSFRLMVALQPEPIAVGAVQVLAPPAQTFQEDRDLLPWVAPRIVGSGLQQRMIADAWDLSRSDVERAVSLGEPDIFRGLLRIPGVNTRDDYTATLWTRGAHWAHTRVMLDRLPIFNPTHAGWLFSAMAPVGIGKVEFFPGVRPAALGEGAAAVIDLETRSGGYSGPVAGSLGITPVSAHAGLDGRVGAVRWMLAGRRTYVDAASFFLRGFSERTPSVPYDFSDLTGRVDARLGRLRVSASAFSESDHLRGDLAGWIEGNEAEWGNHLRQVSASFPVGPVAIDGTVGTTRFGATIDEVSPNRGSGRAGTLPALHSAIRYDRRAVVLRTRSCHTCGHVSRSGFEIGLEDVRQDLDYDGPFSLVGEGLPGLVRGEGIRIPFELTSTLATRAVWAEAQVAGSDHGLSVLAGLRVETGDTIYRQPDPRLAPRLAIRWSPSDPWSSSFGYARAYQYTQTVGAMGGPLGPQLHIANLWILSGAGYPAIRSDIWTANVEHVAGETWSASLTGYVRHASGLAEPDPNPGQVLGDRGHVLAENTATGVEASLSTRHGPWHGDVGYALGFSRLVADTLRYPAPADIRHSLQAAVFRTVRDHVHLGGHLTTISGSPFTRAFIHADTLLLGEPNAQRSPPYFSIDMHGEWGQELSWGEIRVFGQLRNVLNVANRVTYAGTHGACVDAAGQPAHPPGCEPAALRDDFLRGMPRFPLVGLELRF